MKNLFYTLTLLFGLLNYAAAQSVVTINPMPASGEGTVDEPDVPVDAHITNMTGNTIHMKWERIVVNLTPGCETAVCDPNTCWARFINSKNFDMDPNETGDMLVHFYNNGAPCEGIIHVQVTNLDNPSDVTTGVYLFNQSSSAIIDVPAPNVVLYPNPTTEFFSLQNAEKVAAVRVFNALGSEVARYDATARQIFSLQGQAAGTYIIALEDKNGKTFQALSLTKK